MRGKKQSSDVPSPFAVVDGVRVFVFESREAATLAAARCVGALVAARTLEGESCVLGLPTGRTPLGIYRELVRMHREDGLSFRATVTFNLDEYWPIGIQDPGSFHRYMHENFFDAVDLPRRARHVPRGDVAEAEIAAHCAQYDDAIAAAGGIDLLLLGIGRNGHLAFNEPGSPPDSRTRRVALADETREDNARDFGAAAATMPTHAVTVGMATILAARRLLVLAFGERKRDVVREALRGPVHPALPASYLRRHGPPPAVDLYLDPASAAAL
jgi:glucosamine-6-phosphate deaminase